MARAERVALFYDTRSEALGGGEISRYISQMRYLMPKLDISVRNLLPGAVPDDSQQVAEYVGIYQRSSIWFVKALNGIVYHCSVV